MIAMEHIDINVRGRVQGVFFRDSTHKKALSLGLSGFVRNEPDGSVSIEAEGTSDELNSLVEWCRRGPRWAVVDRIEFTSGAVRNYSGFEVRYG